MSSADFQRFAASCRENTGAQFLDSGSAYGRHHEKPPIEADSPECWIDRGSGSVYGAVISTAHYLARRFSVHELDEEWGSEGDQSAEGLASFMEALGYYKASGGNTDNDESDLSQCVEWSVWVPDHLEGCDWIHADMDGEILTTLQVHTGYSDPIVCSTDGDYTCPTDTVADWYIGCMHDEDGDRVIPDETPQEWWARYSGHPLSEVEASVARWFVLDGLPVMALLEDGSRVTLGVSIPYGGE